MSETFTGMTNLSDPEEIKRIDAAIERGEADNKKTFTIQDGMTAVLKKLKPMEGKLIGIMQFTHQDDSHMFQVFVELAGKFVVWTYQAQDNAFYYGHYFDFKKDDYLDRVRQRRCATVEFGELCKNH